MRVGFIGLGIMGGAMARNLRAAGFPGPIYPINLTAGTIQSLQAFATVEKFCGVLIHEASHWTGAETRLNRDLRRSLTVSTKSDPFPLSPRTDSSYLPSPKSTRKFQTTPFLVLGIIYHVLIQTPQTSETTTTQTF